MHLVCLPTRCYFALSANHRNAGAISIFIHVNAERSRLFHRERKIRRIDFVQIAFPHFSHSKVNRALGDARLQNIFVKVQKRQRRHAAQMQCRRSGLQLRAGILIRPHLVADCNRTIFRRRRPVLGSCRLKGYIAIQIADARNARRRIGLVGGFTRSRFGPDQ